MLKSFISRFFSFFGCFSLFPSFFSLNFRFASIFSLNFCSFYLRFRFRFLVFRIEVNHVKSGFFFASKRNEIFASISNFASEAKVRAHPSPCPRETRLCSTSFLMSSLSKGQDSVLLVCLMSSLSKGDETLSYQFPDVIPVQGTRLCPTSFLM